jgi:hypothetical protein
MISPGLSFLAKLLPDFKVSFSECESINILKVFESARAHLLRAVKLIYEY